MRDSTSPHSIISRFEFKNPREKAEQILGKLLILTLAIRLQIINRLSHQPMDHSHTRQTYTFRIALALDNAVVGQHKREVCLRFCFLLYAIS